MAPTGDLLPERRHVDEHEAGQQDGDDAGADDRADDRAAAAEQAGAADHHGRDRVEVVGGARDGSGAEPRHDEHRRDTGEQPGERVDFQEMPAVVMPGPDGRLPAVADGQRVGPEPGLGEQQADTRS